MATRPTPLLQVRGLDKTSEGFRRALIQVALGLGIDPNWLAAVISFESAHTFASDIVLGGGRYRGPADDNKAVGLIQFTNVALEAMARRGWTVTKAQLAAMTPEQQMAWVQRYFQTVNAGGRMRDLSDVYMAVFAPKFIGAPSDAVLYSRGTRYYEANAGLDKNKDGTITKAEAASFPAVLYAEAQGMGPLVNTEGGPGQDSLVPFPDGDADPETACPVTLPPPAAPACSGVDGLRDELREFAAVITSRLDDIDATLRDVGSGQLELAARIQRTDGDARGAVVEVLELALEAVRRPKDPSVGRNGGL